MVGWVLGGLNRLQEGRKLKAVFPDKFFQWNYNWLVEGGGDGASLRRWQDQLLRRNRGGDLLIRWF